MESWERELFVDVIPVVPESLAYSIPTQDDLSTLEAGNQFLINLITENNPSYIPDISQTVDPKEAEGISSFVPPSEEEHLERSVTPANPLANLAIAKISGTFNDKVDCIKLDDQFEIRVDKTVEFLLDEPFTGYLVLCLIHCHPEYQGKMIKNFGNGVGETENPITMMEISGNKSFEFFKCRVVPRIEAYAHAQYLENSSRVHMKFKIVSTDPSNGGRKQAGKLWRLLCVGFSKEAYDHFIQNPIIPEANLRQCCELNVQVVAELRPTRSKKFKRKNAPEIPLFCDTDSDSPLAKKRKTLQDMYGQLLEKSNLEQLEHERLRLEALLASDTN